jgi:short-subunit dehydrogenase
MKKVFITGASRGIGKGLALKYAKSGAIVFLIATNEELLKKSHDEIISSGGIAYYKKCDVRINEEVKAAINVACDRMGGIDIAFLNAGLNGRISYTNVDLKKFYNIIDTNLFGVLNCMACLVPIMIQQKSGTIVGISSLADFRSVPNSSPYNISKIALSYMLEAARVELKTFGIDVITVRPGYTKTDFIKYNKFSMPFLMEIDECVERIFRGVAKNKRIISFPMPLAIASSILKLLPTSLWDFIIERWQKKYREN